MGDEYGARYRALQSLGTGDSGPRPGGRVGTIFVVNFKTREKSLQIFFARRETSELQAFPYGLCVCRDQKQGPVEAVCWGRNCSTSLEGRLSLAAGSSTPSPVREPVCYKFIYLIYLFLAALGLRCCARAFSSCGERGLLFVAVCGFLIVVASLVAEHGL